MPTVLFRFVKQAVSLAQTLSAAGQTAVSDPTGHGFRAWKHCPLHFLRIHMDATYAEIVDWASELDRVRAILSVRRWEFPAPSTLWRSFERAPVAVWRSLLRLSVGLADTSDHAALDATFVDRQRASRHYEHRSERTIQTLKVTALVDTRRCAVLDIHCSAHWPADTRVGRQVALRNAGDLASLAADKGYDDMSLREALRAEGVRPLIKHRLFAPYDYAHNARLDGALYGQRWMAETAFSAIKRRFGAAVRPRVWYQKFRELALTAAVYNVEQALEQ